MRDIQNLLTFEVLDVFCSNVEKLQSRNLKNVQILGQDDPKQFKLRLTNFFSSNCLQRDAGKSSSDLSSTI